ncbi:GNAT family N-acetyltransferase [Actinomycetospora sp. TBRC 11914]|uniref:GNAT family N-acetyltransferase n=1 Tax=Actinomycetospora sp. TBRC 11914 TaxID=2729387 RepID=UPI00145D919A|nr:GNAT family N-acetyltransferase [Actinomycetospora sp. TBRC 11914]NMO89927.1 GNAT family N-acetyltransferase [Actinomycetospora sp. TBRC 11914]
MAIAHVRPATADDAGPVTAVQREVWTSAWAGFLPAGLTEGFDDEAVRAAWARTAAGPGLWVATEGDAVVGFCLAGAAAEEDVADAVGTVPDDAGRVGLVATLLVSPRWGRRGHGGRLLVTATEALRAEGAARGITWVPERDAASRAFYARAGWDPDGTVRTLDAGGRPLREVRLGGPLDLAFAPEPTADDLGLPLL